MDGLQKQIDMSCDNYNQPVQIESHERKQRIKSNNNLKNKKVEQQRKKFNFNQIKLNELEKSFNVQKQRAQLVIDAIQDHDRNEENQTSDANIEKDAIEPEKSNLKTNELETYGSSFLWLKKNLKIYDIKASDLSPQVSMALVVSQWNYDDNVK